MLQNIMLLTWKMKCQILWRRRGLWSVMLSFSVFLKHFFKSVTKMTLYASSHSCRLVWELLWKEAIVWGTDSRICAKDDFWSKTSSKHKNATCFKLKSKPIRHRYFTTNWNCLHLQRRMQHEDWVSVPRCGGSRHCVLRAICFSDSDGDLAVLNQNYLGS